MILCSCESSIFSINKVSRTRVTIRTEIYALVFFVSKTLTFHTRGKFWIEHFFFSMYHLVKVNLLACKYQEKKSI